MSDDKTKPAVSDEMVEKALRAYNDSIYPDGGGGRLQIHRALEAVLPLAPAGDETTSPIVRHVVAEDPGTWGRRKVLSFSALVQEQVDELGMPDEIHYSSCDTYDGGHFVRYSALLVWRGKRAKS